MKVFNEDMRVIFIDEDNELRRGVITSAYDALRTAIVKTDDGDVKKVPFSKMAIDDREDTKPIEEPVPEKCEPVEKPEITITPDEFRDISTTVIAKETHSPVVGFVMSLIVSKIHEALFYDVVDND